MHQSRYIALTPTQGAEVHRYLHRDSDLNTGLDPEGPADTRLRPSPQHGAGSSPVGHRPNDSDVPSALSHCVHPSLRLCRGLVSSTNGYMEAKDPCISGWAPRPLDIVQVVDLRTFPLNDACAAHHLNWSRTLFHRHSNWCATSIHMPLPIETCTQPPRLVGQDTTQKQHG